MPFLCILTSLSVDEIQLSRHVKWFTNFRGLYNVDMTLSCIEWMNSVLSESPYPGNSTPLNSSFTDHYKLFKQDGRLCWRSMDKLMSKVHIWVPTHEHISIDQLAKTYRHHLYMDTGCHLEYLVGAMDDRDRLCESLRDEIDDICQIECKNILKFLRSCFISVLFICWVRFSWEIISLNLQQNRNCMSRKKITNEFSFFQSERKMLFKFIFPFNIWKLITN